MVILILRGEKTEMKKITSALAFAIVALLSLGTANQAQSGDLAPGEGAYLGAFMGYGMGLFQADVTSRATTASHGRDGIPRDAKTFETGRGGIFGMEGIQGGGWAGYGIKTADDIYFGFEATAAASDETFELTSTGGGIKASTEAEETFSNITKITAKRMWTAGGAVRLGYYVNADTLVAVKAGVAVSELDVDIGDSSEQYYAGGPQFGGTIDTRLSKIDPNLSLRMEFLVTNYLTADILARDGQATRTTGGSGYDAELTGIDAAGRIGLTYNFDLGLPSLF